MANNQWTTIVQTPLNQLLDTRSHPPDLQGGVWRYKLNMAINSSGKLCRRPGHARLSLGAASGNWDHHRRGGVRKPITFLYENSSPEGVRQLFDGSDSKLSYLDNSTGEWTDIFNSFGGRWSAGSLRDQIVFTNNVDVPQVYTLGNPTTTDSSCTTTQAYQVMNNITRAKIAMQYSGVILLMNLEAEDDAGTGVVRYASRILWSNYNDADDFTNDGNPNTEDVSGYQDLDYGEEILNAVELGGVIWIFTDRAIWKMFVNAADSTKPVFGFTRWYSEPKNRTACLAYENALVSTGKELIWLSRQTIQWCNQYSVTPTAPEWLHRASGLVFEGDDRIDSAYCTSPVGDFVPDADGRSKEVWFSYPTITAAEGSEGINSKTIVFSLDTDSVTAPYQTADYVDHGYTAFGRFSKNISSEETCKLAPVFIGASGTDYCLKSIGDVFYREMVSLIDGDPIEDIPDDEVVAVQVGYHSIVRALCPFGYPTRDKVVRELTLDHETTGDDALVLRLRIGNSPGVQDPNEEGNKCRVLWHDIEDQPLACPYVDDPDTMLEENTRPDDADMTAWPMEEIGRMLYFEIKITNDDGTAPIGGDTAWASLNWDVKVLG